MASIWKEENKFSKMLKIEILVCEALSKRGKVPLKALKKIEKRARFSLSRIKEIEEKTHHDVVAFIENVAASIGPEAKYLHMGLTSSDLLDTTLALQMSEAVDILIKGLIRLSNAIAKQARKFKDVVCVGRTHGMHAEPVTFGLKLALWYDEASRHLKLLRELKERVSVGKLSGAVGTYAHLDPYLESYVLKKLNLKPANISTQIVQRDVHAYYLCCLALVGSSLEKFATEIRHLQRSEVGEAEEPFAGTQKGSSAMPHKRNPILCERICGLARVLRANSLVGMENISLWHERDISHSSAERITIPDSSILLDYMLNKFTYVVENLKINPLNMMTNLVKTKGLIFSQRVLLELMKKGLTRSQAYDLVQGSAMKAFREKEDFQRTLLKNKEILQYLTRDEINSLFDIDYYLRYVDRVFRKVGL
jgi:adenylosuccinate lyase